MSEKTRWTLEVLGMIGIFFGIFMLCQPFSYTMFHWGFQVCGLSTGFYIFVSHLPIRGGGKNK